VAALSSLSQLRHLDISNKEHGMEDDTLYEYLDGLATAIPILQRLESFSLYLGRDSDVMVDTGTAHLLEVLTMGLSHLERLDVSGPFPGCEAVLHSPALVSLELFCCNGYGDEGMARSNLAGLDQLSSLSRLQCLRCDGLSKAAASRVAFALPGLTRLERLCLRYSQLDSDSMALLASALPSMPRLHHLDLSSNNWPKDGLRLLSAGLPGELRHLDITRAPEQLASERSSWGAGVLRLAQGLVRGLRRALALAPLPPPPPPPDSEMLALVDVLPRLSKLRHLSLAGHAVAGRNTGLICSALEGLTQLESLDVSRGPLGADGVLRVADTAARLGGLRRLYLHQCDQLPSSLEALLGSLPERGLLQHLHVYFSRLFWRTSLTRAILLAGGSTPSGLNGGAGSVYGSGRDPSGSDAGGSSDSESSEEGHE
jgi:hypothetical protein